MAKGKSGRIVIEIDPAQKNELYKVLSSEGLTLKEWFLTQLNSYIQEFKQPFLIEKKSKRS